MEPFFDRATLVDVFERSERRAFAGNLFQLTSDGIWLPTPLDVIESALDALGSVGFWDRRGETVRLLDAGMGDGRLVACFAALGAHVHACGMESHGSLYRLALENLRSLPISNWSICRGSYLDTAAYETLGVSIGAIDAVFNYPDGNERALVRFWGTHARPGSQMVLLTPDLSLSFDGVEPERVLTIERSFRLYLYRV